MGFIDRLRVRVAIGLIVCVPVLAASGGALVLANGAGARVTEAQHETTALRDYLVLRELESDTQGELDFYRGWTALEANRADTVDDEMVSGLGTAFRAWTQGSADASRADLAEIAEDLPPEQRETIGALVEAADELRIAFDARDADALARTGERVEELLDEISTFTAGAVRTRGGAWVAVGRLNDLRSTLTAEALNLTSIYGSGRATSAQHDALVTAIARSEVRTQEALAVLEEDDRTRLEEILASDENEHVLEIRAVAAALGVQPGEPATSQEIGALATSVGFVQGQLDTLRTGLADDVALAASDRAAAAAASRNVLLLAAALVAVLPLLAALVVGGRLALRLRRLSEQAGRISLGELRVPPSGVGGSDEVATLARALDGMSATLAEAHDQVSALAEGRFDDPALDREIPGSIGRTLRVALRRLSAATEELARQASHDALTGLLDRNGLQRLYETVPLEQQGAVFLLDLDDFKDVNDAHGHAAGDRVLVETALRLREVVRDDDVVARIGGDEFVLLVADVEDLEQIADRIVRRISQPVDAGDAVVRVGISVGWTVLAAGEPLGPALDRADRAMYGAKRAGKDRASLP